MVEMTDDEYLRLVRAGRQPKISPLRRLGQTVGNIIIFVMIALVALVFALVLRLQYGVPIPLPAGLVATAGVVYSASVAPPLNTPAKPPQRPVEGREANESSALPPRFTPFYGAPAGEEATPTVESTSSPAPTATESFWTPEEQTQIAQTATAFIVEVPTAPPAFVSYVDERCKDAEIVAQSKLLELFCKK